MNKDKFWEMIETARASAKGDYDKTEKLLINSLKRLSNHDIVLYKDINDEYIRLADRKGIYDAACNLNDYGLGDDAFLDFRAWLVGQGKEAYMNALKDSESILKLDAVPRNGYFEWETFNYIASYAMDKKCGQDLYSMKSVITGAQKDKIAGEIEYGAANLESNVSELQQILYESHSEMKMG